MLRETVTVQIVVLDLEVLAKRDQDGKGEFVGVLVSHSALLVSFFLDSVCSSAHHTHSEGNGEIERVEGCFVNDDEVVPVMSYVR